MKPAEISRLLQEIQKVPVEDISKVKEAVARREGDVESLLMLQERTESVKCCPHCGCVEIVKNGTKNGKQRFWCKGGCGATFNALTGTPLARLRMPEKHIENARCMVEHLSIPKAAERLGVCRETAFRWRHRFLEAIRDEQPEARLPRRERYRPARRGWRRVLRRVRQFNAEVAGERRALPDRAADAQIAAHQLRELPADG